MVADRWGDRKDKRIACLRAERETGDREVLPSKVTQAVG